MPDDILPSSTSPTSPEQLSPAQKSRLYWQCRRGMLELDSLLQGFFSQHIDQLTEQELSVFELLLKTPDDLLLEYLMGRTVPVDSELANVIAKIRQSAGN